MSEMKSGLFKAIEAERNKDAQTIATLTAERDAARLEADALRAQLDAVVYCVDYYFTSPTYSEFGKRKVKLLRAVGRAKPAIAQSQKTDGAK